MAAVGASPIARWPEEIAAIRRRRLDKGNRAAREIIVFWAGGDLPFPEIGQLLRQWAERSFEGFPGNPPSRRAREGPGGPRARYGARGPSAPLGSQENFQDDNPGRDIPLDGATVEDPERVVCM
jgi:hypothetical protein